MEHETRRAQRHYNPWLLQLLYQRVVYRSELLALVAPLAQSRLIWEGGRTAQRQVADVKALVQALHNQACDPLWLCLEEALYRLAALFRPSDVLFGEGPAASALGQLYGCELALVVEDEQQRHAVYGATQRYVQNRLILSPQSHLVLLLNMKHALEREARCAVQWDRELCMALMYCYLLDSLHTDLQIEHTSWQYRVGDRSLAALQDELALLRALHNTCRVHLMRELQLAVCEHPVRDLCARYRQTRSHVVCVQPGQQALLDSTLYHRYWGLDHAHFYQHVAQRFQLDYAVQCQLACDTTGSLQDYLERHAGLRDFYATALGSDGDALAGVLVEQQCSADAMLWRVLYEVQQQFDDLEMEHDVHSYNALTRRVKVERVRTRLLHVTDLTQWLHQARQLLSEKRLVAESETVLLSIACATPHRLELSHRVLASQIVVMGVLLQAFTAQCAAAEQLTRSQSSDLLLCQDDAETRMHRDVQVALVQLYNAYRNALRDAVIGL